MFRGKTSGLNKNIMPLQLHGREDFNSDPGGAVIINKAKETLFNSFIITASLIKPFLPGAIPWTAGKDQFILGVTSKPDNIMKKEFSGITSAEPDAGECIKKFTAEEDSDGGNGK